MNQPSPEAINRLQGEIAFHAQELCKRLTPGVCHRFDIPQTKVLTPGTPTPVMTLIAIRPIATLGIEVQ